MPNKVNTNEEFYIVLKFTGSCQKYDTLVILVIQIGKGTTCTLPEHCSAQNQVNYYYSKLFIGGPQLSQFNLNLVL